MADSQSPEEGFKKVIPENGEAKPGKRYVVSSPFDNDHPTLALVGQTGNTSKTLNIKPDERSKSQRKPYPPSIPELTMEEAQGPVLEGRTVCPRIQAPKPEGTTIEGKEESRGQTDKTRESDESIQPSAISSEEDAHGNEKGKKEDGLLEKSLENKPPGKVVVHDDHPDQTITIWWKLTDEVRLVDTIFEGQIGRNLEAYVDDMVIKSTTELEMIKDVEETLLTLKKAEEAFQAMKKLIAELPTLTAPKKEEELMVYLSAANEAVSVVLLVERNGRQTSIHYVSRTLQGAEINYPSMEKLALAIVHAARRLRRYFQGHTIKVITDKPINQILNNREAAGRLAKWGAEFEAYGIKYTPRSAIKGQVIADLLVDTMAEDSLTQAKTDGPDDALAEGESMEEQEATGSKAPKNLKAETDVEGSYEEKGEKIKKYKEKALEIIRNFSNFQISHIPREENRKVGALSKFVVVQCEGLTKGVLIEELNERSVDMAEVNAIIEDATRTRMTPIQEYIKKGILPEDATEARTIQEKTRNYTIKDGVLYRKSYLGPLFRCIVCIGMPTPRYQAATHVRFRVPATIITENETQLINDPFKSWAKGLGIKLVSASETPRQSNGETPFSLTFGTEAVIPAKIGIPTRRTIQGSDKENEEALGLNLNLLEERRDIVAIREARRKLQVEKYYNHRVHHKQFKVGEFVLQKNKLLKMENIGNQTKVGRTIRSR
ncbi:reverse transcriptase domain-containing protein [Tanacetum coccineum]